MGCEKMKILFLNTNIGYGGASKIMAFVANILAKAGHQVTFLTYRNKEVLQPLSTEIIHIHKPWEEDNGKSVSITNTILSLHKHIKAAKYDIAVAFLSPSQLRLAIACFGTKTKVLFSQRGDPYHDSQNKGVSNWINTLAFLSADYYVFQTEGARRFYNNRVVKKSVIIPNPVEKIDVIIDGVVRDKRIVNVARLDIYQKRQDILIQAFQKFQLDHPDYMLHLYGDGPDENELKSLAQNDKNIIFHGAVNNVLEDIKNAAIFVLTSDFEGIPNALIEAMELGIPCISTKCSPGGAELLITHAENGLLVDCGDVDGIAEAMKKYVENPGFALEMGTKARNITYLFSEEKIGNMWINLFSKIRTGE